MTGTRNRLSVRLNGGKPWGFRLQGGAGTGLPLTVSKVRRKSKAYRNLFEGDLVVTVNGRPCENLTYDQVMEIVDSSATELNIDIIREGSNKENVAPLPRPTPTVAPTIEKTVTTTSSFEAPSSESVVRKETVTLTESTTKVTETSEGFRIKSVSCQPGSSLSIAMSKDTPLTNQSTAKTCSSVDEKPLGLSSSFGASDISVPSLTKTCSPFDTSTKSVSQEVTSDDRKFEKSTMESMHEKHGNTETSFVKTEHESVIKNGSGPLDSEVPSLVNGHLTLREQQGGSTLEESRTSSYKSVEKSTKETLSSFISDTEKEVTDILTSLGLKLPFEATTDSVLTTSASETKRTSERLGPVKKVPPPPPPKPKIRPFSDPCVDRYLELAGDLKRDLPLNAMDVHSTGTSSDIFPPFELPFGSITVSKKKKMFSSSSFYEEPHAIYPTVEEQVEMAKKIASSLADDTNKKSKGANMFYKRVKKSTKWVHEGPEPSDESGPGTPEVYGEQSTTDPFISMQVTPQLKLVLDPRHTQDAISLRSSGHIISEHNVVSPDVCHGLVRDLQSPVGKGAALFAKRKKKSSEWVVDEEKVRSHMRTHVPVPEPPMPTFNSLPSGVPAQRVKLMKTPWDAALESPIGSCDAAFVEVSRGVLADSVIQAAENKRRDSLPTSPPHDMDTCRSPPVPMSPAAAYYNIYKPKAPKGWIGSPFSPENSSRCSLPDQPLSTVTETSVDPTVRQTASLPRKMVFQNFNTVPRQWRSSVN